MRVIGKPLSWYISLLQRGIPFSFARYGDGEWFTILGHIGGHNSNGCTYTQELSLDLRQCLSDCHATKKGIYQLGILTIAKRKQGEVIDQYLKDTHLEELPFYGGDIFLNQLLKGNLLPFFIEVRKRRILYVGNQRLKKLPEKGFFDYCAYLEAPPLNAHLAKEKILETVFTLIERENIDFIGWSSGLAAKVFINEVFKKYSHITQIDFGSMFDGFFEPLPHIKERSINNSGSRSYIRKGGYDWEELRKLNTERSF